MQPDSAALVWDALSAGELIEQFTAEMTAQDYLADQLVRSAVERQFEVIGEAPNRLRRIDPLVAESIPDLARIVAFRNILAHGYAAVDNALVWNLVSQRLSGLTRVLRKISSDIDP
jgi:uncharacterized protein with HEPN domain